MLAPGKPCLCWLGFQQTCVSIEMLVARACASSLLYRQFNYGQFFRDAVMSTHIFRTCPSSEMTRERKRGSGQVTRFRRINPTLPKHTAMGSPPADPIACWGNPSPQGVQTKPQAQFSFTPPSSKHLTTNSPNVEKEIFVPLSSFLSPSSPTSYGQFLQKGPCFFPLSDIHLLNTTMCQVLRGTLAMVTK